MKFKHFKPNAYEITDFDRAVYLTGYGKFHFELIAICAVCVITVGFQNGLSSYVFPAAQCELSLTSFELGLLNIMFLTGGIISCFLWGVLADTKGRRKILVITHLLNVSITLTCAFVPHKGSLVICRFFNGFFIGAPGAIIFSYFAEFQPPKYRSASVCCCGLFFTSSWILLPVFAHLVLPLDVDYELGSVLVVTPWRLYLVLMVVPELVVGVWFTRMPESPKFFITKGHPTKALVVLRRMYSRNTGKCPDTFSVRHLVSGLGNGSCRTNPAPCAKESLRMMLKQSRILFKPSLVVVTALTCAMMFSNMFGVFGLGLWIPELFLRFKRYQDLHPNSTVTIDQLSSFTQTGNSTCQPSFDPAVIQGTVAMAISSLLYNLTSSFLSTKIHTRVITVTSMLLGGVSAGSMYFLKTSFQNLVVACLFQASMVTANMTIGSIVVDLFPTEVSAVALCLLMCAGRLGAVCSNVFFGYFIDDRCEIPIFVVAAVVVIGAALCLLIPNKTKADASGVCGDEKAVEVAVIS